MSIVRWLSKQCSISRIRLTGGEPLLHAQIGSIIAQLAALPGIQEVTMTTNGVLLGRMAKRLREAGLRRVNVSLDSAHPQRFAQITRGGRLERTLAGVRAAVDAGLLPVKLNSVLLRSTWKDDVPLLLHFAQHNRIQIRFIELMRTGTERLWCDTEFISASEVCKGLGLDLYTMEGDLRNPARETLMEWDEGPVSVGWITPRSQPFCQHCTRLRMDAHGRLRRCLMDPLTLDLVPLTQQDDADSARAELFAYLARKTPPATMDTILTMNQVGG